MKIAYLLIISLLVCGNIYAEDSHTAKQLPILGEAPAFSYTERSGKPFDSSELNGKVWIADFIFTRCAGICPLMANHMRMLQESLKQKRNIRFVSFTVDPEHDTPEVLSKYAQKFSADPTRWLFLTGPKKEIFNLSERSFHLGVGDVPEKDRAAVDQNVMHSSKFALVDSKGKIRGYYDSQTMNDFDRLIEDAKTLLKEAD